ncbi:hypothetical protein QE152_g30549 [Popillia japonica]|uniref:Uncharacterized protein n=1 Tax=Popillia japonica TaxID=7064 RepID=A0AAW1JDZ5_POPJA
MITTCADCSLGGVSRPVDVVRFSLQYGKGTPMSGPSSLVHLWCRHTAAIKCRCIVCPHLRQELTQLALRWWVMAISAAAGWLQRGQTPLAPSRIGSTTTGLPGQRRAAASRNRGWS